VDRSRAGMRREFRTSRRSNFAGGRHRAVSPQAGPPQRLNWPGATVGISFSGKGALGKGTSPVQNTGLVCPWKESSTRQASRLRRHRLVCLSSPGASQ
jgi:hypothetical protein